MRAQVPHDRRGKPARVAELDRVTPLGQGSQPSDEALVVAMEVGRKLPEDGSQASRFNKWFDPLVEPLHALVEVGQALDVGEIPAGLDGEDERVRGVTHPRGDAVAVGESVEGRVDLDGVKALRVQG
jgi:hypothetical protein